MCHTIGLDQNYIHIEQKPIFVLYYTFHVTGNTLIFYFKHH